jgi:hypothetical protein
MPITWTKVTYHELPITEGRRLHEDILVDEVYKMGNVNAGVTPDGELILVFCYREEDDTKALAKVCDRRSLQYEGGTKFMLFPRLKYINIAGHPSPYLINPLTPEMEYLALVWLYQQLGWEMPADQANPPEASA